MIAFVWPYLFLLAPLPWLIRRKTEGAPLLVPEIEDFACFSRGDVSRKIKMLSLLIWLFLLTAAARPEWVGDVIQYPQTGRDLMLAVDLSGSMQIEDFQKNGKNIDRLTALKGVASDFIDKRGGDRIGLILFGGRAYLQTPLTFDLKTVKQLLMESAVGLAGNETAIGDAIAMAIKQMQNSPHKSRVLILLTDGVNNAGELTTEKAAEIASRTNLKIHTIAIGASELLVQTLFGKKTINPSADLDEASLKLVAEKTGGKYFRAYNTAELENIYAEIDELEKVERSTQFYRPTKEMYMWPLLVALCLIAWRIKDE